MRFIGVALGPPVFAALMSNANWLIFILSAFCGIVSLFLVLFTVDAKKVKRKKKLRDGLANRLFCCEGRMLSFSGKSFSV